MREGAGYHDCPRSPTRHCPPKDPVVVDVPATSASCKHARRRHVIDAGALGGAAAGPSPRPTNTRICGCLRPRSVVALQGRPRRCRHLRGSAEIEEFRRVRSRRRLHRSSSVRTCGSRRRDAAWMPLQRHLPIAGPTACFASPRPGFSAFAAPNRRHRTYWVNERVVSGRVLPWRAVQGSRPRGSWRRGRGRRGGNP